MLHVVVVVSQIVAANWRRLVIGKFMQWKNAAELYKHKQFNIFPLYHSEFRYATKLKEMSPAWYESNMHVALVRD